MDGPKGYLALILHAHLPFVRHPEHESFLEEDWLFEAITESYLPLLEVLGALAQEDRPFRLALSLTPPLASMLADPLLQERYVHHLEGLIDLAGREVERTRYQPAFHPLARMYRDRFAAAHRAYTEHYRRDLLGAFRALQDAGRVEILASAATHAYLPLLEVTPEAVRAQVEVGVMAYRDWFGRDPRGFWLPECGFNPGDDRILRHFGIRWTVLDSHGILHARPRPRHAVYSPVYCPGSGLACYGRDWETSKQVWSADEGYPGDYDYREFYRDIGHDLDLDYLRPWLKGGVRSHTGIKYYRITGPTAHKEPYDPERGRRKADIHAGNFLFNRERQVEHLAAHMDRPPLVVAPYDAELFGHWWFEGPRFLDYFLRKLLYDQRTVGLATPGDYLEMFPRNQVALPSLSSWGYKGYSEVWLEGSNDWLYRHLHKAADRMVELAARFPAAGGLERRALNQAARELLLAQSSDWAFILKTGTVVDYARRRFHAHIGRFTRLYEQLLAGQVDEAWLAGVEARDNLFPGLDYRVYAPGPRPREQALASLARSE